MFLGGNLRAIRALWPRPCKREVQFRLSRLTKHASSSLISSSGAIGGQTAVAIVLFKKLGEFREATGGLQWSEGFTKLSSRKCDDIDKVQAPPNHVNVRR